jgi:hypothetical protein
MRQASTRFMAVAVSVPVPGGGTEEGSLAVVADAGRLDIRVEIGFEIVMHQHLMPLAAFLMSRTHQHLPLG